MKISLFANFSKKVELVYLKNLNLLTKTKIMYKIQPTC